MIKDTSALSFAAIPLLRKSIKSDFIRLVAAGFIVCLPLTLWMSYVSLRFPTDGVSGSGNFTLPFVGIITKVSSELNGLASIDFRLTLQTIQTRWFEVLCPLTLFVQAIYLLFKPRPNSQFWRFGIGFAVLVLLLGDPVWAELNAYTRVCLPLTFAFNLLIHKFEKGKSYFLWFLSGNIGMSWSLYIILRQIF